MCDYSGFKYKRKSHSINKIPNSFQENSQKKPGLLIPNALASIQLQNNIMLRRFSVLTLLQCLFIKRRSYVVR